MKEIDALKSKMDLKKAMEVKVEKRLIDLWDGRSVDLWDGRSIPENAKQMLCDAFKIAKLKSGGCKGRKKGMHLTRATCLFSKHSWWALSPWQAKP